MELLKEFKPALMFLGKFLALYFAGNILYGIYIESYEQADGVTRLVTAQTSWCLDRTGYNTSIEDVEGQPKIAMKEADDAPNPDSYRDPKGDVVLYVFEGCNGVNVMIVFIAFLFAFGGSLKSLALFLPLGILVIHLFNLLRIGLLFHLALTDSRQFYYYHKYFFTAILYIVVFGLWAVWVIRFNEKRKLKTTA